MIVGVASELMRPKLLNPIFIALLLSLVLVIPVALSEGI